MNRPTSRRGLLLALVATLLACVWVAEREEGDVEPAAPIAHAEIRAAHAERNGAKSSDDSDAETSLDLGRLFRRQLAGTDIDPFRALRWYVPPPVPLQAPTPPPKPTAPPLPFQFVGRTEEVGSEQPVFHLSDSNTLYTVAIGESFATVYRLEQVGREGLRIRYLPLSILQTLPLGTSE